MNPASGTIDPDKAIFIVGTADTKGEELQYLYDLIKQQSDRVVLLDVGTTKPRSRWM